MRIALAQINPTVGDLAGNEALIADAIAGARDAGASIVVLPELAVTGYPPEDLLLKEHFLADARATVERLAAVAPDVMAVVGFPERASDVHNAAAVLHGGTLAAVYRKVFLPNYGVFDEHRYFLPGVAGGVIDVGGVRVGLTICEDVWEPGPPLSDEANAGASLVLNLSASPYHAGKGAQRERMLAQRARDSLAVVAFCNVVGGQDELLFDGHSLVLDHEGNVLARAAQFEEELLVCDVDPGAAAAARLRDARPRAATRRSPPQVEVLAALPEPAEAVGGAAAERIDEPLEPLEAEVYKGLVLGLRDYVRKNGFGDVVLGLSGGIDSGLVATLAVDALGADRVHVVIMPSPYSSDATQGDARAIAANLGVHALELPIADVMSAYEELLGEAFTGRDPDLTEENLQARIRGNLLMALSNKFDWLVVTTGNKSEMSVGYSTLYGDSAGGFAPIKDCPKLLVYSLSRWRNEHGEPAHPILDSVVERPPSAELRPDQRDSDSLPPYERLDPILEGYVERDLGRGALVAAGMDAAEVDRVIRLVNGAEYKRRQAPPGIKITPRSFGRDRRLPITNRYGG
jgi:NAD+ synthase (glutamine-hydrolysing)